VLTCNIYRGLQSKSMILERKSVWVTYTCPQAQPKCKQIVLFDFLFELFSSLHLFVTILLSFTCLLDHAGLMLPCFSVLYFGYRCGVSSLCFPSHFQFLLWMVAYGVVDCELLLHSSTSFLCMACMQKACTMATAHWVKIQVCSPYILPKQGAFFWGGGEGGGGPLTLNWRVVGLIRL